MVLIVEVYRQRPADLLEVFIKDETDKTLIKTIRHYKEKGFQYIHTSRRQFGLHELDFFKKEFPNYTFKLMNDSNGMWSAFLEPNCFETKVVVFFKIKEEDNPQ